MKPQDEDRRNENVLSAWQHETYKGYLQNEREYLQNWKIGKYIHICSGINKNKRAEGGISIAAHSKLKKFS